MYCPNGGATGLPLTAPCAAAGTAVVEFVRVATPGVVAPGAELVQPTGTDKPPIGTALPSPPATLPKLPTLVALAAADPAACAACPAASAAGNKVFARVPSLAQ